MRVNKILVMVILTLILMFIPLFFPKIEINAASFNSNICTYEYKGCTLQLRQTVNVNGEAKDWSFWYGVNENPDNWAYCNNSSDAKAIGTFGASTMPFLNNFEKTKKKLDENECPDIRVRKKTGNCKTGSGAGARRFKCYPLDKKTFVPGKCKSTADYDCVSYTEYEGGVDVDDLPQGQSAKIDELTAIEITNNYKSCDQLIGDSTKEILEYIFLVIRVATPIILIVLTMLDFSKAIAADENELQNAITRFVKRTIAAILIFLAPTLIEFLMDITGISDGTCGLDL